MKILRMAAVAAAALLWTAVGAGAAGDTASPMLGFSAAGGADEQALEQRFDAELHPQQVREWLAILAREPNQVGSPHDRANAEFVLQKFRDWGWQAQLETYQVLYPTPKRVQLQMLSPHWFNARLNEPAVPGDASSTRTAGALPPYNIFGADGDVTAELVYVNQGMPDDYQELARRHIDVRGRIVIARYGGGWRGLKVSLAYQHGAIGCIIYSDPHEDGYGAGEVYPQGGWRPADGVQRGSVADNMAYYFGDPLTPDVAATPDAKRLPISEATPLQKIPSLPISYADAQPLLAALAGAVAPASWRGGLPITYHIGPGPARVRLRVLSDWSLKTIYDVIARLPGLDLADEWVVRGNHRDAWVFGAWDPLFAHTAMLAEAQALGHLAKSGWRPRRTLVYCSWDGEESALMGSTEWSEAHAEDLKHHAVLYLNSDTSDRGYLSASGSHSLQRLVNEVAGSIRDPESGVSVLERARARLRVDAYNGADVTTQRQAQLAAAGEDLTLEALGSGSDYSPFLQHLGIASLDVSYTGEGAHGGVYHSTYDDFEHFVRFDDPSFAYGVTEAETVGHLVLRVADAAVLPLQFGDAAEVYSGYVRELHQLAEDKRQHQQKLNELLQAHAFELSSDPLTPVSAPSAEEEVPFLDFSSLDNATAHLVRSARLYQNAYDDAASRGFNLPDARARELETTLQGLEQVLTSDAGLPGRPWYRHLIYAPGRKTGYAAKTLPAVREAIEDAQWDVAAQSAVVTAQALEAYALRIEAAAALLRR